MSKLNTYKLFTVTHKTAPNLQRIGDYVIKVNDDRPLNTKLEELKAITGSDELMYLSTCNRVMYLFAGDFEVNPQFMQQFLSYVNPSLLDDDISSEMIFHQGVDALRHIYEVASSIDSLVIGEREILRQLREAYDTCRKWKLTGDRIRLLMRFVVKTAKSVYANTRIGEKPISIVSLAMKKLIGTNFSKKSKVLLIGAGQTNLLVSKFLLKYEYNNVTVFNRTIERAARLAEKFNGHYHNLVELEHYDSGFDIIIVCTGATTPIITTDLYKKLVQNDGNKKLIIDLGLPNNVSTTVVKNNNVEYIEIEDLRVLAQQNLSFREKEVANAQKLIKQEIIDFEGHFKQREIEIAMRAIPTRIKAIKSHAMNEVFKKEMQELDQDTRALMEKMMAYMEKKCISIPMTVAKDVILKQKSAS